MSALLVRGLGLLGAAAVVVSLFLGWFEYTVNIPGLDIRRTHNPFTAWELFSGRDIALLVLAVAGGVLVGLSVWSGSRLISLLALGIGIAGLVIVILTLASPPTRYNAPPAGLTTGAPSIDTSAVVGPYVAIGGFALIVVTGLAPPVSWNRTPLRKRCPDCAKRVSTQARVCRFCGYRFDD